LGAVIAGCCVVATGLYALTIDGARDVGRSGRSNAAALAELEARLGLGWTHDLAGTSTGGLLGSFWAVTYALGYWPFLAAAAVWASVFDAARFRQFAAVIGITGLVGVTVMTVFPVSPPRLVGASDPIVGTALEPVAHPERFMNEHGAMPSFHVAWSVAAAATMAAAAGPLRRARRLAWLQPVLMAWATVATANHWVSDVIAGLLLVAVSWRPVSRLVAVVARHIEADRQRRAAGRARPHSSVPARRAASGVGVGRSAPRQASPGALDST
jgi:membrane-associated phospholipid phosphatase